MTLRNALRASLLLLLALGLAGCRDEIAAPPQPKQSPVQVQRRSPTQADPPETITVGPTDLLGVNFNEDLARPPVPPSEELLRAGWMTSGRWPNSDLRYELGLSFLQPSYSQSPDGVCEFSLQAPFRPPYGRSTDVLDVVVDQEWKEIRFYPPGTVGNVPDAPVRATATWLSKDHLHVQGTLHTIGSGLSEGGYLERMVTVDAVFHRAIGISGSDVSGIGMDLTRMTPTRQLLDFTWAARGGWLHNGKRQTLSFRFAPSHPESKSPDGVCHLTLQGPVVGSTSQPFDVILDEEQQEARLYPLGTVAEDIHAPPAATAILYRRDKLSVYGTLATPRFMLTGGTLFAKEGSSRQEEVKSENEEDDVE